MGDWSQFVEMGGYGAFVWPSFAITAAVLVGLLWASVRELRSQEAALNALRDSADTPAEGVRQ